MAETGDGDGTRERPWKLKTPSLQADFTAWREEAADPPALVVQVGKTELRYHLRCLDDLSAMLKGAGDWVPLGSADELAPGNYVDPAPRPVPLWGERAHRAYLNAIECFAPFAALVIVAHLAGKANGMTAIWAMSFFWLRVLHCVVYWFGVPFVRTVVFTLGYVAVAGIFWEVVK